MSFLTDSAAITDECKNNILLYYDFYIDKGSEIKISETLNNVAKLNLMKSIMVDDLRFL